MIQWKNVAALSCILIVAACGTTSNDDSAGTAEVTAAHSRGSDDGRVAPPHLIEDSDYSDVRFCSMMAPHHQHAIEMAQVEIANGERAELIEMARMMVVSQASEIEELKSIKQELTGDPSVPTKMNPHRMVNSGTPMPPELLKGHDVDSAFLDGMLPHHSGAIQMATVALRHSQNPRVVGLARRIVDAQSEEIGEMIAMRKEWYPQLTHGFPHAR